MATTEGQQPAAEPEPAPTPVVKGPLEDLPTSDLRASWRQYAMPPAKRTGPLLEEPKVDISRNSLVYSSNLVKLQAEPGEFDFVTPGAGGVFVGYPSPSHPDFDESARLRHYGYPFGNIPVRSSQAPAPAPRASIDVTPGKDGGPPVADAAPATPATKQTAPAPAVAAGGAPAAKVPATPTPAKKTAKSKSASSTPKSTADDPASEPKKSLPYDRRFLPPIRPHTPFSLIEAVGPRAETPLEDYVPPRPKGLKPSTMPEMYLSLARTDRNHKAVDVQELIRQCKSVSPTSMLRAKDHAHGHGRRQSLADTLTSQSSPGKLRAYLLSDSPEPVDGKRAARTHRNGAYAGEFSIAKTPPHFAVGLAGLGRHVSRQQGPNAAAAGTAEGTAEGAEGEGTAAGDLSPHAQDDTFMTSVVDAPPSPSAQDIKNSGLVSAVIKDPAMATHLATSKLKMLADGVDKSKKQFAPPFFLPDWIMDPPGQLADSEEDSEDESEDERPVDNGGVYAEWRADDRVKLDGAVSKMRARLATDGVVNLSHSMGSADEVLKALTLTIQGPNTNLLTRLYLQNNSLQDESCVRVQQLLQHAPNLELLDLSNNKLTSAGLGMFMGLLSAVPNLHTLSLAGNNLGNAGARLVADELRLNKTIKQLDISKCGMGPVGANHIGDMVSANGSMTKLAMGWNFIGPKGCEMLADNLNSNVVLRDLSIAWAGLGDKGVASFYPVLGDTCTLERLDISANGLGIETCVMLAEAFHKNYETKNTLQFLGMNDNPIGFEGAVKLMDILSDNCVETITLTGCSFAPSITKLSAFNPFSPQGNYKFDIARTADRAHVKQLYNMRQSHGPESWQAVKLNAKPFAVPAKWEDFPTSGMLEFNFRDSVGQSFKMVPIEEGKFSNILATMMHDKPSDDWIIQFIEVFLTVFYINSEQARVLLEQLSWSESKMDAAVTMFGRVTDLENFVSVSLKKFSAHKKMQVAYSLGIVSSYHASNVTARYMLTLSRPIDYYIALQLKTRWILEIKQGNADALRRCWRNITLDNKPLLAANGDPIDIVSFSLPDHGVLCLDYVQYSPPQDEWHVAAGEAADDETLKSMLSKLASLASMSDMEVGELMATLPAMKREAEERAAEEARRETRVKEAAKANASLALKQATKAVGALQGTTLSIANLAKKQEQAREREEGSQGTDEVDKADGQEGEGEGEETRKSSVFPMVIGQQATLKPEVPKKQVDDTVAFREHLEEEDSKNAAAEGDGRPAWQKASLIQNEIHFNHAWRAFLVHFDVTCRQALKVTKLHDADTAKVLVVVASLNHVVDPKNFARHLVKWLPNKVQNELMIRLGPLALFRMNAPSMHYRLRLWQKEDLTVMKYLFNMAKRTKPKSFFELTINGNECPPMIEADMWPVLIGNAPDGTLPQTEVEFDFYIEDSAAATVTCLLVQTQWRRYIALMKYNRVRDAANLIRKRWHEYCERKKNNEMPTKFSFMNVLQFKKPRRGPKKKMSVHLVPEYTPGIGRY